MKKITALLAATLLALIPLRAETPATPHFSVVQFNIWQEGTSVPEGLSKIAKVVIKGDADVYTFSEVRNYGKKDWHDKLIEELKKQGNTAFAGKFVDGDVGLVSKFPIVSTEVVYKGGGSIMAYRLELPDKRVVTVCSAHIDYRQYGLNLVRGYQGNGNFAMIDANKDGVPDRVTDVKQILEYDGKSRRGAAITAFLEFAKKEAQAGRTVILAGDFNEASHLDWTPRAAKEIPGHYGLSIPWSTSTRLLQAGFTDGYRKVFPDEVAYPGFTWPAVADKKGSTSWAPKSDERDRIDFIYYSGPGLVAKDAAIVGPRQSYAVNIPTDNPGKDPFVCDTLSWPSDHKAVKVDFEYVK